MEDGSYPGGTEAPESVFRSVAEAEVSLDEMLSLACRQGKQDIVELLLESGANVNHRNKAGNTPLLEACSQGHVSIAKLLLDRNADIDAPTETTYDSALTWACTLGNVEIVQLLLERKANVEHRTKDGCTALMFAALAGHEKVAKLLLDHRAEINVESDSNKDSPLTFACWKGHEKVVKLFLERKADIEHRTKEGFSPLMFAALGGHTGVAELLLKHRAEVNIPSGSNNDIPLTSACWKGHHHVVQLLLLHNSDIEHRTKDGCTPLMLAAREGHLSVAQLLLLHGAKVNVPSGSENNIPLTLACWKGHRDVVHLLLKHKSNIEHQNKAGCTPLMLAAREGHLEATKLLLDSGAQINVSSGSNDDTPLTLACWKGHEDVVQLLILRNSSVNHQTKTGCTPLMEATREGHVGVAKLLLEAGADVETPDNYGQSPFFMACWKGHADVAALLLEYDANKDCRTKTGITPLFQACRENHVDVVKLLLDYGCNPITPFPNSRECPLTLAAEKGFTELAQLLLSRSANVEARTKKGCTPFYLTCREGYKEIAVMLAKHGASTEAVDHRGITPLLASYKCGHVEVVEWLLAHVAHLPSDAECHKAFVAPMPQDTDLLPRRTKCLELIMKAKKAREQAALKNAQSLFEELDAEREKKERREKAAAKKRNKRKEKKRKEQAEKMQVEEEEEQLPEKREDPDGGEELTTPTTNRGEESAMPTSPPSPIEALVINDSNAIEAAATSNSKKKRNKSKKKKLPPTATTTSGSGMMSSTSAVVAAVPSSTAHSGKRGSPEGPAPAPLDNIEYWSSGEEELEFHDAQSELPDFNVTKTDTSSEREAPVAAGSHTHHDTKATSSSRDVRSSNQSSSSSSAKRGGSSGGYGGVGAKPKQSKHVSVTPSASTSVTSERESGVGGVATDEGGGGGTRGKHQSNDSSSSKTATGSDRGRGMSPISSTDPPLNKGAMTNNTRSSGRKWGTTKSSKESSSSSRGSSSSTSTSSNVPHHQGGSSNPPHPHARGEGITSTSHRNNTPPPTSTSQPNSTRSSHPASSTSGKRNDSISKELPPSGRTSQQQQASSASRGKGNPSRSTVSKSHRQGERDSGSSEHQRVGKRGSSGDSSRGESDKEGGGGEPPPPTWVKKSGPRNASSSTANSTSNERVSSSSPLPLTTGGGGHVTSRSNQKSSLSSKLQGENAWNQDVAEEWADEEIDPSVFTECSTDDDKLRNKRKMKAAAVAAQSHSQTMGGGVVSRPLATTGVPTPTTTTTVSSTASHSWQEVTKTTRTVQLTVSNALVGRIIGRGGMKINSIQDASGAHINVSRNIPKSTERLITIKGTQRSITKAQELIDEALSTPDNTLDTSTSSPTPQHDGGSKVNESSKKLHPQPTTTTVSETSRYIPTNTMATRSNTYVASAEYSSRARQHDSKTGLVYSGVATTRLETGLTASSSTTTTTTYSGTVTTSSVVTLTRMNPWSRGRDTPSTSITTVTSSSHSQSESPVHEEVSLAPNSLLTSAGSSGGWDSEEDKEKVRGVDVGEPSSSLNSQVTNEIHVPRDTLLGGGGGGGVCVSVTPEPNSMDMNEEFPPLSKHGRSQSDPQVSSAERQQLAQQDSNSGQSSLNLNPGSSRLTQSLTSQIHQQGGSSSNYLKKPPLPPSSSTSSSFTPSVPPIEVSPISMNERGEKAPRSHRSASGPEKLPFASPAKRNQSDPAVLQGIKGAEDLEKTTGGSRVGRSGSEDGLVTLKAPGSMVVGGDMEGKPHHRLALPSKSLPLSSQDGMTSDLPSSSQGGGNYGAIGIGRPANPVRRSSMPSNTQPKQPLPLRKTSYAGLHTFGGGPMRNIHFTTLENVSENDPFTHAPFTPPPNSVAPPNPWMMEGPREHRSLSWTGQHPMAFGGMGPTGGGMRHVHSQPPQQHMASFLPKSVPPPSLNQSDDPLIPISTPETPHGENMVDQAFAPQGVYGPIGSNMPSNPSNQMFSHSVGGMSSSLGNSPLSSPQLHRSDIWVYPFSTNASNTAYTTPTPIGVLPAGYQPPPPPLPQPIGMGGAKPNPFQRAVGGQMHKGTGGHHHGNHGGRSLEHRGHSLEEDFLYGSNNPNPVITSAPYHHKRWSVPSGMYAPQPAVGGFHPNSSHSPEIPSWGPHAGGGMAAGLGNPGGPLPNLNKKPHPSAGGRGSPLSLTDPWPHWISPVPPPQFLPSVSLPPQQKSDFAIPPKVLSPRLGRSISVTLEGQWSSPGGIDQDSKGGPEGGMAGGRRPGSSGELQQLMKSLDINSEHMQSLKARKLSLEQLHSMSADEWKSLDLPVGPRVKLMNAISNINKTCKSPPNTVGTDTSSQASTSSDSGLQGPTPPAGAEMTTPPNLLADAPSPSATSSSVPMASQDAPNSGESPFLQDTFQ